jgi:hypothetical protein
MMLEARGKSVERLQILHLKKDGTYKLIKFVADDSVPMALITLHTTMNAGKRKNGRSGI